MARIMIVDDSLIIRSILKKFLIGGGHEVVFEASNGIDAVEGYKKSMPELVTMDINMPDISGISAVKKILEFDPKAKIVMVSGVGQKEIVLKAIEAGAIHFIVKPVTEKKTNEVINEVLNIKN